MTKCPVCDKPKSEYEMRPLINVEELKVADQMSEQSSEREVGGAKLQMVCRACWAHILSGKTHAEVVEMMETLAGLLLELDRRAKTPPMPQPVPADSGFGANAEEWLEKMRRTPITYPQPKWTGYEPNRLIGSPIHIIPLDPLDGGAIDITYGNTTNTVDTAAAATTKFFNIGGTKVNWNHFKDLGDEWMSLVPAR